MSITAYYLLRWAGRVPWMGSLLAWILGHGGKWLPMKRILETEHLQAFHHPKPSYPLHILIIPKEAIASLLSMGPDQSHLLEEVLAVVRDLVGEFGLQAAGYRLIVNGGPYQEIPQLHFHLVCDSGSDSLRETD